MLAAQTQYADGDKEEVEIVSYREHMALFASDSPEFYPPPHSPPPEPTLRERLDAAWTALGDWSYARKVQQDRARWRTIGEKRKARAARQAAKPD